MADLNALLAEFTDNLNTLQEREAKHTGNAPLDLLNRISDYQTDIAVRSYKNGDNNMRVLNIGIQANTPSGFKPPVVSIAKSDGDIDLTNPNGSLVRGLFAGRPVLNKEQKADFARHYGVKAGDHRFVVLKTPLFDDHQVMFIYPKRQHPLDSMKQLYQYIDSHHLPELPDALAAAIIFWSTMNKTLDDRTQQWIGGAFSRCAQTLLDRMWGDEPISELEAELLEEVLTVEAIVEDDTISYDLSGFDMVRFACQIGEWLWQNPLALTDDDDPKAAGLLNDFAFTYLTAKAEPFLKFREERIPVIHPARAAVWSQFSRLAAMQPPPGALSFLFANGLPRFIPPTEETIKIQSLDHLDTERFIHDVETDAKLASSKMDIPDVQFRIDLANDLTQNGLDNRRLEVGPEGKRYLVHLPESYPTSQLGYNLVRIVHYPNPDFGEVVLYVFEDADNQIVTGVWSPQHDELDSELLTDYSFVAVFNLTIAAIWRDLVVEDTAALRPMQRQTRRRQSGRIDKKKRGRVPKSAAASKYEVREWGASDEVAMLHETRVDLPELSSTKAKGLVTMSWILEPLKNALG